MNAAEVKAVAQLGLVNERMVSVDELIGGRGLAAEVSIAGLTMRWVVEVLTTEECGTRCYMSSSMPDGSWSPQMKLPPFRDHPIPTDQAQLHAYCRWFFAPKAAL